MPFSYPSYFRYLLYCVAAFVIVTGLMRILVLTDLTVWKRTYYKL